MTRHDYQLDSSRHWTDAQRAGVLDRSGSVIVSAAAGTGKTSVLAERCVSLVAGPEAVDIDRLLLVTFTEAAALEMRNRIRHRLAGLYDQKHSSQLRRQVAMLDAAAISTLHSFCLQVARENFSIAGIDPDAGVLDDDEAQLLKDDVLDRLFDRLYTGQDEQGRLFVQFVATYGQGRDEVVRQHIKHLHEYLRSLPPTERDAWKHRAVAAYALDETGGLRQEQFEQMREAMLDEIDLLLEMGEAHLKAFERSVGPHKGLDSGRAVQEQVRHLREQLVAVTTATGFSRWLEGAGTLSWIKVSRWGDVPASYRTWPKWLHDEWRSTIHKRWLVKIESWCHGLCMAGPYAALLLDLVNRFDRDYARLRRQIGKIDYSDMEEHTFRLLAGQDGRCSDIARSLQQRYEHVLVDEFQDINPIQAAILRLVSRESADVPQPNMFTVGDVKQSIYGFRMTDPGEFLSRQRIIREGTLAGRSIHLQENFRSRPEVLAAVNHVFARLMRGDETGVEYDESAGLKPGKTEYAAIDEPPVEVHILDGSKVKEAEEDSPASDDAPTNDDEHMLDRQKEAYLIAQRIRQLVGTPIVDGQDTRQITYRDIVILLRGTQTAAEIYASTLRQCGIPVYAELRTGYFASQEIRDMLSLLAVLENMRQDIPLAAVLRSPLFGQALGDADLADIRLARRDLEFHQAVRWYAESGQDPALRERVGQIVDRLDRWRGNAQVQPLAEVISTIYQETGLLEYATLLTDGMQRRANLLSLYERARQFGQFARQGLRRFVTFVGEMIKAGRESSSPTAVSQAQDVVRVMSVHTAKGLEFPVVFLADLGRQFNDTDFNQSVVLDRRGMLGLEARDPRRMVRSDTLIKTLAAGRVRRQNRAEELRILYVAMTRAKDRLILVGSTRQNPDEWLEEQQHLWARQTGRLPRHLIRHARCPLDWIGATLAANGDLAAVAVYPREVTDAWRIAPPAEKVGSRTILAKLEDNNPPPDEKTADSIIARLTRPYRYEKLTSVPAIKPVTELKGLLHWNDDDGDEGPYHAPPHEPKRDSSGFAQPRRLRRTSRGDLARQKGTATHLFLEKVDLCGPSDRASLQRQMDDLVAARVLTAQEAEQIDLGSVDWLLNETELGRTLRRHPTKVRREMSFLMRMEQELLVPGSATDSRDRWEDAVLVRGVIDVLWTTPEGIEIADFKTDAVTGAELRRRIDLYKDQLRVYAKAIDRIWKTPVNRMWLAFLHARHIEPI